MLYLCKRLGQIAPGDLSTKEFCLSSASPIKLSTIKLNLKLEQEPDACVRCICKPKRVIHISLRMASEILFISVQGCRKPYGGMDVEPVSCGLFLSPWSIPVYKFFFT
jgi:hypothetical protein